MLLNEMCNEIFEHVFQDLLPQEHQLDYAHGLANLEIKLSHILFHLNDHHHHVKGFILSDSNDLFFYYLKIHLTKLFDQYNDIFLTTIPIDFQIQFLTNSFCDTIQWWFRQNHPYTPNEIAQYYIKMLHFSLLNKS